MTLSNALIVLVVVALLGAVGAVFRAADTLDLRAAFRDRSLARAARRLARDRNAPAFVERTYWSARDYQRDSQRLMALGYSVAAESVTGPYIVYHVAGRGGGRTVRRRVALCSVTYSRQRKAG